jgi:hypothetical protein
MGPHRRRRSHLDEQMFYVVMSAFTAKRTQACASVSASAAAILSRCRIEDVAKEGPTVTGLAAADGDGYGDGYCIGFPAAVA